MTTIDDWIDLAQEREEENKHLRAALKEIHEISTRWGNSIPWKEGERIAEICAQLKL